MINIDKGSVKFGTSFVEGVKQTLGQTYEAVKEAVPVVGQVEEFYAGSEERERARLLERGFTPEQIQAADVEKQQYTKTGEATSQFIQGVSDVTNIAPELVQAGAFALESLVEPGFGASVAFKRGAAALEMRDVTRLQKTVAAAADPAQNYYLTVTDPRFIAKGVAEGVGQSELYKAGVQKLRKLQEDGIVKRKLYQEQFDTGVINEKQLKSRLQKLKKREDANYSTLGTVEDPDIFEVQSQIQKDPIDPSLPAHQHHAAGKAMTSPWVQQALKLGDDDDVVAFFELHRMLTGSGMGNVKSGIIDMPGFAHIPRDARTPADVPMAVHSFMKKSGADIEILSSRVEKIIGNPKNMDELMEKYATFAAEYLIPQKELSLKRLNQVLTEHRRTLPPEQIKTFDDLVSKLNKANT